MNAPNLRVFGFLLGTAGAAATCTSGNAVASDPPPIKAFTSHAVIKDPVLSPDGRYLAVISSSEGRHVVLVRDINGNKEFAPVMRGDPKSTSSLEWCYWASESRLMCGFLGSRQFNRYQYAQAKIAFVDADGKNLKESATVSLQPGTRFDSTLVEHIADDPYHLMVRVYSGPVFLPDGRGPIEQPSTLQQIDIQSGRIKIGDGTITRGFGNIYSDGRGHLRLTSFFDRSRGIQVSRDGASWTDLTKATQFSKDNRLAIWGVNAATGRAFAYASNNGRKALWEFDLEDKAAPTLAFAHPKVDVGAVVTDGYGAAIGVYYDTDRPHVQYADEKLALIIRGFDKEFPDTFNYIQSLSKDRSVMVIATRSDVESGRYFLYRATDRKLTEIGSMQPGLISGQLAKMKYVEYPAQDSTKIPAYLTTPTAQGAGALPLIIMPHSGYAGRSRWEYDALTQFLASRGFAVMNINYRGSAGYGQAWLQAGVSDWNGVVYGDVIDATKWAIAQGIADPKRICIFGNGFSSYVALTAASRNPELFKCAISLGGRTDSSGYAKYAYLMDDGRYFTDEKERADGKPPKSASTVELAEAVKIPVLLIHATEDTLTPFAQSERLAKALGDAGKQVTFLKVENADQRLWRESERKAVFAEVEAFLAAHLHGPK